MNPKVKLILYVLVLAVMAGLGYGLYATYHSRDTARGKTTPPMTPTHGVATNVTPDAPTNQAPVAEAGTNVANTAASNVAAGISNDPASGDDAARRSSPRMGRIMGFGAGLFACLLILALLISSDVSRYLANRVDQFIFNDDLEGVKDPEYEEAERVWASGQHLEAIQLMRDYLKRHPREQYAALRIAEIYEADLHNYLAAALEYEEVLKKRLPAERWGWAAIHLANIYSGKLNKTDEATVLLRRIVDEYGQTGAAKKARERLGLPEPLEVPMTVPNTPEAASAPVPDEEPPPSSPSPPPSNLPPGFRPK